jgi:hypothetical protein
VSGQKLPAAATADGDRSSESTADGTLAPESTGLTP